ncbi:transcriptional regulator [Pseudolysobacter antarcticus]|uniref:Transcriptional regulator n=1 Tax=Pseudolysobacter antarcticus TaxID=2511995 RepID=A0A411HNU0_9GAMM|nr:TfoX/Sxy family protein [Pseudolysobacter antarcticus]QBB72159.1 transcriptional regulator [Pseudolysobacter antarcticus]
MATAEKIRNVGPKSAAWLRQIGVKTQEDLLRIGPVESFMKVKRAGFRVSLNLLYSLAGAIDGCHWTDLSEERRAELLAAVAASETAQPIRTRWQKASDASDRSARAESSDDSDSDSHQHDSSESESEESSAREDRASSRFE